MRVGHCTDFRFVVAVVCATGNKPYIICVLVHVPGCLQRKAWSCLILFVCLSTFQVAYTEEGLVIYCLCYLCVCPRSRLPTEEGLVIYCLCYFCVSPRSRLPTEEGLVMPYIICVFLHVPGCLQRKAWSFTALRNVVCDDEDDPLNNPDGQQSLRLCHSQDEDLGEAMVQAAAAAVAEVAAEEAEAVHTTSEERRRHMRGIMRRDTPKMNDTSKLDRG